MLLKINDKTYNVKEAHTTEELTNGLNGVDFLPEDGGMLFFMPNKLTQQIFTMEDMKIPLDIVFINLDKEVIDVAENVQPGQPQVVSTTEYMDLDDYIAYVLEINPGSGIEIGDDVEFEGLEENSQESPMLMIIGPDGLIEHEFEAGARIFSRKFTKQLVSLVKKAWKNRNDEKKYNSQCKVVGMKIFKEIKAQDKRKPEYVEKPE